MVCANYKPPEGLAMEFENGSCSVARRAAKWLFNVIGTHQHAGEFKEA